MDALQYENCSSWVRQYFPKGTNFGDVTEAQLDAVADSLNTRPRRTLGWRSPAEAYAEAVALMD